MNREVVADLIMATPGIVLMAASGAGLIVCTAKGKERISHLSFRSMILLSASLFALMWLRIGWFHIAPHNWASHTFVENALAAYCLQFLPSKGVFLFFAYPILELAFIIRARQEERHETIQAVTLDFVLAAGNVVMAFLFILMSVMFSQA